MNPRPLLPERVTVVGTTPISVHDECVIMYSSTRVESGGHFGMYWLPVVARPKTGFKP